MRDFSTLDGPGPAKFQELVVRFKHLIPTKMVEICQAHGLPTVPSVRFYPLE